MTKMLTPKDLQARYGWSVNICRKMIKRIPGAINRGLGETTGRWVISVTNLLRWEEGESFQQEQQYKLAQPVYRDPEPLRRRTNIKEVPYLRNRTVAEERARLARKGELVR